MATSREVVGLDAELYLPQAWADDPERMMASGVPENVGYQPKWQLALTMLRPRQANGLGGIVLADSAFGTVTEFRTTLESLNLRYCVGIDSTLKVIAAAADLGPVPKYSGRGQPPKLPLAVWRGAKSPSVRGVGRSSYVTDFRKVTWREGTKGKMQSRFAAWRVRPAHRLSAGKEPLALLVTGRTACRRRTPGEVLL